MITASKQPFKKSMAIIAFSSFLVEEVTFRQIEISQKLISYFWECIENEILHLNNLYLNAECESRLSKPKEHRIA